MDAMDAMETFLLNQQIILTVVKATSFMRDKYDNTFTCGLFRNWYKVTQQTNEQQ